MGRGVPGEENQEIEIEGDRIVPLAETNISLGRVQAMYVGAEETFVLGRARAPVKYIESKVWEERPNADPFRCRLNTADGIVLQ